MKVTRFSLFCLLALALQLTGCAQQVPEPRVITVVVPATSAPATAIPSTGGSGVSGSAQATSAPVAVEIQSDTAVPIVETQPTVAVGSRCTIKQTVNFRSGPGTAYNSSIGALTAGTVVLPQAYQSQGFPGGSWVQVVNPGNQTIGWVNAGSGFITCTVDLTSLPGGTVPPTPFIAATATQQPAPIASGPKLLNPQVNGDQPGFVGKVDFSSAYFLRLEVHKKGGHKDGDGIHQVEFSWNTADGTPVDHIEHNHPYCIFGGGSNCGGWPKVNGQYAWSANGPLVQNGENVFVTITATDDNGNTASWNVQVTVNLPQG